MPADPNATNVAVATQPPLADAPPTAGGRYALGDEIARGGMGAVFRATDTVLGREVAVKVLQERFAPDGGTARRFADEARIAAQLQHPGIPPVHDFGTLPDGRPFLAMKLIKGETLDALLSQRPDPSADRGRFVAAFEAVCQAVAYAHARDVVHRDLKPANVMVGAFGEVQVMDWGLAKVLRPGATSDGTEPDPDATAANTEVRSLRDTPDQFTQAGSAMGTPAYMPPEQAVGAGNKVGPWSDVFGLGAILAVILTGKAPFAGDTAETTRVKAAQGDVADCFARLDASGAEPELVALCKRCLAPKPADRFPDAGEVAAAVAFFRQDAEARARQAELDRVKATTEAAEQRKRRRVQVVLAAAVVLLIGGATGVALWRADENAKKREEAIRLEGEENQRREAERERKSRAADAVADLLGKAKAALAAEDSARAGPLLDQAARRATDGAVADHADRLAAYARDLAMLRTLDGVNNFRWTRLESKGYPPTERVVERWAAAFAGYGIVPESTPPVEAAARINGSPIRTALVAGLDGWLARSKSAAVRDLLVTVDKDPFRDIVRRRLTVGDSHPLMALAGSAEWVTQPSGLALAYAGSPAVPAVSTRALLARVVVTRRADFALLMQLGESYPIDTPGVINERARWFQAAVALNPHSTAALNNLGLVLLERNDLDGAAALFREAVRLGPKDAGPYFNLAIVLLMRNDLEGAAVAFRESVSLDPNDADAQLRLGHVLRELNDLDGAAAAYRESIRLDPTDGINYSHLGGVYEKQGRLELAEAAYREGARVLPIFSINHTGLGDVLRKQGRHADAVAAYRAALGLPPTIPDTREGLDYCLRVMRGEVPTAPPPRAVGWSSPSVGR